VLARSEIVRWPSRDSQDLHFRLQWNASEIE
jgi:hypothetical protein